MVVSDSPPQKTKTSGCQRGGIIQLDRTLSGARWALSPLPSDRPFIQMPHSLRTSQAAGGSREVAGGTPTSPCWWALGRREQGLWVRMLLFHSPTVRP